jgi:hypothetical protein
VTGATCRDPHSCSAKKNEKRKKQKENGKKKKEKEKHSETYDATERDARAV